MLNSLKIYTDIPFTHPLLPILSTSPPEQETLSGSRGEILIEKLFPEPSFQIVLLDQVDGITRSTRDLDSSLIWVRTYGGTVITNM